MRSRAWSRSPEADGLPRLFFALWPDASVRSAISAAANRLPEPAGRRVPEGNLHLTLAFLGEVEPGALPRLEQAAADVAFTPFTVELDHVAVFAGARVRCLGASAPPPALAALHDALTERLAQAAGLVDLAAAKAHPFTPHVTIERAIPPDADPKPAALAEPIAWAVSQFVLVHSDRALGAGAYQRLGAWPKRGSRSEFTAFHR